MWGVVGVYRSNYIWVLVVTHMIGGCRSVWVGVNGCEWALRGVGGCVWVRHRKHENSKLNQFQ